MLRLWIVTCFLWVAPALAAGPSTREFDRAFNAAARSAGSRLVLKRTGCDAQECIFTAGTGLRIEVSGTPSAHEIAVYVTPADTPERRRAAAVEATRVILVLQRLLRVDRPDLVTDLLQGAGTTSRRGEVSAGGWRFVLSATLPDDIRVYVSR